MAQEMDTLVCDALIDVGAFPEVAPPPLKGKTWLLGRQYNLPQGIVHHYYNLNTEFVTWLMLYFAVFIPSQFHTANENR